jgi:hypothetical protein
MAAASPTRTHQARTTRATTRTRSRTRWSPRIAVPTWPGIVQRLRTHASYLPSRLGTDDSYYCYCVLMQADLICLIARRYCRCSMPIALAENSPCMHSHLPYTPSKPATCFCSGPCMSTTSPRALETMHARKSLECRYACMLHHDYALDCQAPCAPLTPSSISTTTNHPTPCRIPTQRAPT